MSTQVNWSPQSIWGKMRSTRLKFVQMALIKIGHLSSDLQSVLIDGTKHNPYTVGQVIPAGSHVMLPILEKLSEKTPGQFQHPTIPNALIRVDPEYSFEMCSPLMLPTTVRWVWFDTKRKKVVVIDSFMATVTIGKDQIVLITASKHPISAEAATKVPIMLVSNIFRNLAERMFQVKMAMPLLESILGRMQRAVETMAHVSFETVRSFAFGLSNSVSLNKDVICALSSSLRAQMVPAGWDHPQTVTNYRELAQKYIYGGRVIVDWLTDNSVRKEILEVLAIPNIFVADPATLFELEAWIRFQKRIGWLKNYNPIPPIPLRQPEADMTTTTTDFGWSSMGMGIGAVATGMAISMPPPIPPPISPSISKRRRRSSRTIFPPSPGLPPPPPPPPSALQLYSPMAPFNYSILSPGIRIGTGSGSGGGGGGGGAGAGTGAGASSGGDSVFGSLLSPSTYNLFDGIGVDESPATKRFNEEMFEIMRDGIRESGFGK